MIYTKENLVASIENEFRILKHLWEKIPVDTGGYKPTEGQRTTLELLQYLSTIFVNGTHVIYEGNTEAYKTAPLAPHDTSMENFPAKMDAQLALWKEMMEKFDDVELANTINIYGMGEMSKGRYLVENLLKWAAAYKMQLFLYIKASGNSTINTANLWGGIDMAM